MFGLDPLRSGRVRVGEARTDRPRPRESIRLRLGFLSEDRKGEGLALERSVEDNLTLSRLAPYARAGWLALGRRRAAARELLQRLRCRPDDPAARVAELSGGNQQKVAFA